jgi:hypothetical protein
MCVSQAAQILDSYFGEEGEVDAAIAPVANADSFAFSGGLPGGGVMLS